MAKKQTKEADSEQFKRFIAEGEKLISDGGLSPTEAAETLDKLVKLSRRN